ncbi:MAG: hypothetical protein JW748_11170 [Anaerolineales bacterium]|nr:hypothetical protein [Anaerolineales bacterium]
MASATRIVYDGAMIHHRGEAGVLGIGAGNFAGEKYTDEKGTEARRAAAGLWLVVRGHSDTTAFHRVHAGKQIRCHNFQIMVLAVGSDRRGMYVRLEVSEPGGGANASGRNTQGSTS